MQNRFCISTFFMNIKNIFYTCLLFYLHANYISHVKQFCADVSTATTSNVYG